ncbi:potassium channel family protein [Aspergillus clavatus NRRL 1]|uniref:Ion channel, putative n=1 Tax=Aspergillus clavatus (strain ATCC 1007 / CBS 513.65 / DSM 816 / NCTC 3887 / NRRL 1 / QM 1276 / 107) TaxID=344612 RepID=A1CJL5_ASPCL|nr:ion channel, putative [Aspergillus clavatus NRRL 1]EAW09339.1 ion channel, putative [Aspergillus clavatus NRRL 1]
MTDRGPHDDARNIIEEIPHHALPPWWWLSSTAYPLLAGTLGPMASAFNICSLSETWSREFDTANGRIKSIPDPDWVIEVNAVSLACAIVSNLVLLWSMARRISFVVAQPIIIIGWYISSILLICLLGIFSASRNGSGSRTGTGRWLTGAYYFGIFAAGLYFLISSLLSITVYGAYRGHYSREYRLTANQRSLMLQTILFLVYLLGGAAVYARIEKWQYLEAVYWADFTLLTIGIGDFAPKTHLGRGLLFPYAVGGILILGLIISSIRAQMLEKGRQKMAEAVTERTRRFLIRGTALGQGSLRDVSPSLRPETSQESDRERRRREFQFMRRVRQISTLQRKWISLVTSLIVWMMLWLLGAIAFWLPGQNEKLTYFEALYFAYTTLFTIGFGDFHATSDWERSFFVFWTLLAVPTVTLLIANVGDTIVRTIRDITIYLGELTILPGDKPVRELFKDLFRVSWKEKFLAESVEDRKPDEDNVEDSAATAEAAEADTAADGDEQEARNAIEADEHKKEESARARGDVAAEETHHHHYLLFREVRRMIDYATRNLHKEFDYHEWEYFLKLIGNDEDVSDGQSKDPNLNWTSYKSPLLGQKTEVQWLLEALTEALERELRKASRGYHSPEPSDSEQ